MELVCEKHKERMDSAEAACRHPQEYCKFRSACMIHFLAGEKRQEEKGRPVAEPNGDHGESATDSPPGRFPEALPPLDQQVASKPMDTLRFDKGGGLLPAIVQDWRTNEILMVAYINEEAWQRTLTTGKAHYWSRSRNQLWLKGESSQHFQLIKEILVDCDADTVIYKVEQQAAACHKGYRSCFFRRVEDDAFVVKDEPVFDPKEVYKK